MAEAVKHIIFNLNDEKYGMDIMRVNAIQKYQDVVRIPNAPRFILGIINLRGEVIPVYSLRKKFGLPEATDKSQLQLIITRSEDVSVAFEVDSINEIVEIDYSNVFRTPKIIIGDETQYIKNIANVNKSIIIILDVDNILSKKEKRDITNMVDEYNKEEEED